MTSTLDRYFNRENVSMQFTVGFPPKEPTIEFSVKRIPQAILDNAKLDTRGTLKRAGVEPPEFPNDEDPPHPAWQAYNLNWYVTWAGHIVDQGRTHFYGWKSLREDRKLPPFSQAAFAEFLSYLGDDKQILGIAYLDAASTEKKSLPETSSGTGS